MRYILYEAHVSCLFVDTKTNIKKQQLEKYTKGILSIVAAVQNQSVCFPFLKIMAVNHLKLYAHRTQTGNEENKNRMH